MYQDSNDMKFQGRPREGPFSSVHDSVYEGRDMRPTKIYKNVRDYVEEMRLFGSRNSEDHNP